MATETTTKTTAVLEELRAAEKHRRAVEDEIEAIGENEVERVAAVHETFTDLLDRYESTATGTGREEFQSYVEFEAELADFEEQLEDDLPEVAAFEEACEQLDRRRLEEQDFERARTALEPATEIVELLTARRQAIRNYRDAREQVSSRIATLEDRIEELEDTLSFADVDLEQSVEPIRSPIETYNDAIQEAFQSFYSDAPAREVLSFLKTTEAYPLVAFPPVPEDLSSYIFEHDVGRESIPTLLEYAEFSLSKLQHYVGEPRVFRTAVAANRTFLVRLDANPLTIEWPPAESATLRCRVEELIPVVDRIAPSTVVANLRSVRDSTGDPQYEELREVAIAKNELDATQRERLQNGDIEAILADRREERDRLQTALSEYPAR